MDMTHSMEYGHSDIERFVKELLTLETLFEYWPHVLVMLSFPAPLLTKT